MKEFAELFAQLDASTSSNAKLLALQNYFQSAEPADAAWAVFFLAGGKPKQVVPTKVLRQLILDSAALPEWLFEECYEAVGDLAETLSLLLPPSQHQSSEGLASWVENKLLPLRNAAVDGLTQQLLALLELLDQQSQLVFIKLITGSFRVGVSKLSVTRALAAVSGCDAKRIAQRLVGYTEHLSRATADNYLRLIAPVSDDGIDQRDPGQPYPFFLAHPIPFARDAFEGQLGLASDWQIEWKWDGIRAQLVKRDGHLWIWSRGEELITERFPELHALASVLVGHGQYPVFVQLGKRAVIAHEHEHHRLFAPEIAQRNRTVVGRVDEREILNPDSPLRKARRCRQPAEQRGRQCLCRNSGKSIRLRLCVHFRSCMP